MAAALSLAFVVGGCGDDEADLGAYCSDLETGFTAYQAVQQGDAEQLDEALTQFHALAASAPTELIGPWSVLDAQITKLEQALTAAGITPGEAIPADLDDEVKADLAFAMADLNTPEYVEAAEAIEKHAASECDLELR